MAVGLDVVHRLDEVPVGVDDERGAADAHVLAAGVVLLAPDAVLLGDCMVGIGQQGPLWLINTRAEGEKPGDDGRGRWVWGVFYMRVGE